MTTQEKADKVTQTVNTIYASGVLRPTPFFPIIDRGGYVGLCGCALGALFASVCPDAIYDTWGFSTKEIVETLEKEFGLTHDEQSLLMTGFDDAFRNIKQESKLTNCTFYNVGQALANAWKDKAYYVA